MAEFLRHTGVAASIPEDNVDTDQIIPSREMKAVSKKGLGSGLFAGWRYRYEGTRKTGESVQFVLNQPDYAGTSILLAGKNFGCGSSREHAVWALRDYGIRVIIAESFGRIFGNNCARNGLLAIRLSADQVAAIRRETETDPQENRLTVDLENCVVTLPGGAEFAFDVESFDRDMLMKGLDYIDFTLQFEKEIDRSIKDDQTARPWAHL
ncbi:MAG: 3-isopropylmalate dehydratase small subunit [Woeseiaceae bacterium]